MPVAGNRSIGRVAAALGDCECEDTRVCERVIREPLCHPDLSPCGLNRACTVPRRHACAACALWFAGARERILSQCMMPMLATCMLRGNAHLQQFTLHPPAWGATLPPTRGSGQALRYGRRAQPGGRRRGVARGRDVAGAEGRRGEPSLIVWQWATLWSWIGAFGRSADLGYMWPARQKSGLVWRGVGRRAASRGPRLQGARGAPRGRPEFDKRIHGHPSARSAARIHSRSSPRVRS